MVMNRISSTNAKENVIVLNINYQKQVKVHVMKHNIRTA